MRMTPGRPSFESAPFFIRQHRVGDAPPLTWISPLFPSPHKPNDAHKKSGRLLCRFVSVWLGYLSISSRLLFNM